MTQFLKRLKSQARSSISPESWAVGVPSIDRFADDVPRAISLEPLIEMVNIAQSKFVSDPKKSDAWLAPRVHATLRLQRWEAADQSIWDWLTIGIPEFRTYLKWRWSSEDKPVQIQPLLGGFNRHAFARLWWGAELSRDGASYEWAGEAFAIQNTADFLILLNAFHNRPTALAWLNFLSTANAGERVSSGQVPIISKRLDHAVTTLMLDDLAPDPGPDTDAVDMWIREDPDVTLFEDELPEGPREATVDPELIASVRAVLQRLWNQAGLPAAPN